jgi:UDPglucose 6-dehydrogenase
MRPDRVVIGAESNRAEQLLRKIHDPLFLIETPMVVTNLETAELIKYAANCFLATKISFINEIANLCEALGADVQMVAKGIGMDRRIGSKFLHAGPGYGGSCFPKDTHALSAFARAAKVRSGIVDAVIEVNERQMRLMVNTDDLREAPALAIIAGLKRRGVKVQAFDPVSMPSAKRLPSMRGVEFAADLSQCAKGAHALVLITEWNEFRNMDLARLKRVMKKPVLCDLRNLYDRGEVEAAGWSYSGVGRGGASKRPAPRRKSVRRAARKGRT